PSHQSQAGHDTAGRCVPASLPASSPAVPLHAHSQLRFPRKPAARGTASTLFPPSPAIRSTTSTPSLPGCPLRGLALELSALWRNHAGRRAALCDATPPQISTSSRPVRSMNPHPQSPFFLVLRHPRWLYVSYLSAMQNCSSLQTFVG